ncbi:MAG: serine protease [Spirochaetales bacterium]|nr:serine protease [Spirochaetales bacterium]
MFKKNLIYILQVFFLFLALPLGAQDLRSEVAIVRALPIPSLSESYTSIANWVEGMGQSELAKEVRAGEAGVHGSAFSFNGFGDERLYVTNYHVVAGSDSISLEWKPLSGEKILIENCEILYVDPLRDLALIALPKDVTAPGEGFEIASDKDVIKDGMEIWAAGYPGLISSAAWQLSNGIVSNQRAVVEELVEEGRPYLIQHTSPIDPGSSGGPLLVKDNSSYQVVGVNSMTAVYRHNTFFAVPSDILLEFIGEYQKGAAIAGVDSLEITLERFVNDLSLEERSGWDMSYYLSDEYSCERGFQIYMDNRRGLSSEERNDWDRALLGDYTLEALKGAVGMDLLNEIPREEYSWTVITYDEHEAEILIESESGKEYLTKWGFSKGLWTLHEYPSDYKELTERGAQNKVSSGDKLAYRSAAAFYGGASYTQAKFDEDAPEMGGFTLGVDLQSVLNEYLALSYVIGWEKYEMTGQDSSGESYITDKGCLDMAFNLNLFPTKLIRKHLFTPWARAGVGLDICFGDMGSMDDSSPFFYYFWQMGAGTQFAPDAMKSGRLGIMLDYKVISGIAPADFGDEIGAERIGLTLSYITGY